MAERKITFGISLPPELFEKIEFLRKGKPRSVFLTELIANAITENPQESK